MWRNLVGALTLMVTLGVVTAAAQGWSVVTDGRFTNVYVYRPDFPTETWDQHLKKLRPDPTQPTGTRFTRAAIDHFTDVLMTPGSPSYFDWLNQYSGIHPPLFFGSGVASQRCVDAAMKDLNNGVMQWDTIRSLANCHNDGEDPSPQVALIFSPDIKIGKIGPIGNSGDMCATKGDPNAWHAWGLNVPNFIALPTDPLCAATFEDLTSHLSHEIVETLSDPGTLGEGGIWAADPNFESEVGDKCNDPNNKNRTTWSGFTVTQYFSNNSKTCEPRVFSPPALTSATTPEHSWLDVSGLPLMRFTGKFHDHAERVSPQDIGQQVLKLQLIISTGNDDLRGGKDNCYVTIQLKDGRTISLPNINRSNEWGNWSINTIDIPLPAGGLKGGDVTNVQLHVVSSPNSITDNPDNWNLQRIQLKATVLTPLIGPGGGSPPAITQVPVVGNLAAGTPFDGVWVENVYAKNSRYFVRITSKQVPFGPVTVASFQIGANELLAPGSARVTFETAGTDLYPTLARTPEQPDGGEHIDLPDDVSLYLYRILNNGSFLNYGIRYVRFANYLTPDKKSSVRRKLVDIMLQPLQSPLH